MADISFRAHDGTPFSSVWAMLKYCKAKGQLGFRVGEPTKIYDPRHECPEIPLGEFSQYLIQS